jgi:hypothetical protein
MFVPKKLRSRQREPAPVRIEACDAGFFRFAGDATALPDFAVGQHPQRLADLVSPVQPGPAGPLASSSNELPQSCSQLAGFGSRQDLSPTLQRIDLWPFRHSMMCNRTSS